MTQTLSSRQTFFTKVVSPVVWIGGVGLLTLGLFAAGDAFSDQKPPVPAEVRWLLLALWLAGSAFVLSSIRFKRVRMGERSLQISNYLVEIEVLLTEVAEVEENCWLKATRSRSSFWATRPLATE